MIEEHYRGIRGYREENGLKKWYPASGSILDIIYPLAALLAYRKGLG